MTAEEYTEAVKSRLAGAFDFKDEWLGKKYDAAAVFHERVEQTALFRENVTDWYENTEVCLISCVREGADAFLQNALAEVKGITVASSKPSRNHRCTAVTRVIAGSGWTKESEKAVRRFRFSRSFRLGFYGWCTAAVLLADLESGRVISNWAGRRMKKYFSP